MPAALQVDRELVKALFVQGFNAKQVHQKTGVNPRTVETWARKHKWREIRAKAEGKLTEPLNRLLSQTISAHNEKVRSVLAESITVQAESLLRQEVTFNKLRNTPDGQGLASVTKTIAESAALVHGWGTEKPGTIIIVDDLRAFDKEVKPQPVDIQATVTPQE